MGVLVQGFDFDWYKLWIDDNGEKRSSVYVNMIDAYGTHAQIVTPRVLDVAKSHYDCNTLTGADLENNGDTGSAGSHWEYRTHQVSH